MARGRRGRGRAAPNSDAEVAELRAEQQRRVEQSQAAADAEKKTAGWRNAESYGFKVAGWRRPSRRHGQAGADSIDHIVPTSRGGSDARSNLRPAHIPCNLRKGDRDDPPSGIRRSGDLR